MAPSPQDPSKQPGSSPSASSSPSPEPYTTFPRSLIRLLTTLLALCMLVSPLTATIYLPLLPLLSSTFHTTPQAINLTITLYIVLQALSPILLSSPSDHLGRRHHRSYAALLTLRGLQSLGASAVLSIAYGVVADVSTRAERGKLLGPLLAVGNVGTCVGPIVGGWIARESGGFVWVFGGLAIFGGVMWLGLVISLPETARNVVGNGRVKDGRWWMRPLGEVLVEKVKGRELSSPKEGRHGRIKFTSPLAALRIVFYADTALILWIGSSYYALWYCIQASIPSIYKSPVYGFDELQVGLAYLPGSAGVIVSMYIGGKAIDYNYRYTARQSGLPLEKVEGDDFANFPVEKARSRGCSWLLVLSFGVVVGYGWSIQKEAHVAIPLTLQFFQGFIATWLTQCYSTLLVDGFPITPSTAATTGNMMRCVLSAIAVTVLKPLVDVMGQGWFFTMLGVLSGVVGLAAQTLLRRYGKQWRNRRIGSDGNPRSGDAPTSAKLSSSHAPAKIREKPQVTK